MRAGMAKFFDTTYAIWRNPEPDETGKIGEPVIWKSNVKMTQFWPLVALMRIAKAPQVSYEVKVAYTNEMSIKEGDTAEAADGEKWYVEGVDRWDEETLEIYAWEIH